MRASPSPIGRLPTELLSEIFQLCNLSVEQTEADICGANSCMTVNPFGLEFTFLLSTVCRKWRNIILNQANLWSNICVTQSLLASGGHLGGSRLDTTQIRTCLQRSRGHPLNILIDARDADWNWTEDGVGIYAGEVEDEDEFAMETEEELMPVLFTPEHMVTALSALLPHLPRWKSLVILTDTWAPMHGALKIINPAITNFGAPMLDTLTLLRCNELPSYFHDFQPGPLKDPAFLSNVDPQSNVLPRLKNLSLEGVHADWDGLRACLLAASGRLESLELRYHCAEVRPSFQQYRKLLGSVPSLKKLAIKCSGAYVPEDFVLPQNYDPVSLPLLNDLALGYQTSEDGEMALELFDAPNVKHLALEDRSHYASADQYADDMLTYLASKASYSKIVKPSEPSYQPSACESRREHSGTTPQRAYFSADTRPPFPLLESVALTRVDGSPEALHALFFGLEHLRHVEIASMTMDALRALLPSVGPYGASCPCPQLRSVRVHDTQKSTPEEFRYYYDALMSERPKYACPLQSVDLEAADTPESIDDGSDTGSVQLESEDDEDEALEEHVTAASLPIMYGISQYSLKDEITAFQTQEIFNEPALGTYYSPSLIYH
ncbi:hypothetical protein HYPSUDRAFT_45489 [Hypholoma sublateritium FD-334 SS-4]|uniref:Uncharacterized protein n=1 Tax=Hypholoma sublateritium (strain FD-334 SS-4) TaxID=945553 RepID=A0A0D2NH55_HYPSF|nr:hypothetical protein HYPSUDRAFT_45489 [Hypholoma sublateritium FD-334 SS-4]